MSDLVQRLRDTAAQGQDIYGIHCNIELEAADRIEVLEMEIRHLVTTMLESAEQFEWDSKRAMKLVEGKNER
jgi:hypothetical protein